MVTIAQIIGVSYKNALKAAKDGRHWTSHELEYLQKHGRIQIQPLGATVQKTLMSKEGVITAKQYPVSELSVPHVWTKEDDLKNSTEKQKVDLVYSLLKNGWHSHDDLLLQKIGDKKAIVSRHYRYYKGETIAIPDQDAYCYRVSTAFALID